MTGLSHEAGNSFLCGETGSVLPFPTGELTEMLEGVGRVTDSPQGIWVLGPFQVGTVTPSPHGSNYPTIIFIMSKNGHIG